MMKRLQNLFESMSVDATDAEDILEEGQKVVSDIDCEDAKVEELEEKLDDLRYELEHDTDKLEEATKDTKDLIEEVKESEIHQEPEMEPEKEREAREQGPVDEEYSQDSDKPI